jgi:hypothetical protein
MKMLFVVILIFVFALSVPAWCIGLWRPGQSGLTFDQEEDMVSRCPRVYVVRTWIRYRNGVGWALTCEDIIRGEVSEPNIQSEMERQRVIAESRIALMVCE